MVNFYIVIAGFVVICCIIMTPWAIRWHERRRRIKPFDGEYQGLQRSLLKELEKELR